MNQFAEPDDDAARMAKAEIKLFGITVTNLLTIKRIPPVPASMFGKSRGDAWVRVFLEDMDTQLNVFGTLPDKTRLQYIKDLAWLYRRQMAAHLAPKLPPRDPIVLQMGEG